MAFLLATAGSALAAWTLRLSPGSHPQIYSFSPRHGDMRTRSQTSFVSSATSANQPHVGVDATTTTDVSAEAMRTCVEYIRAGRIAEIPYAYTPYFIVADYFVHSCLLEQIERDARDRETRPEEMINEWHFGPASAGKSERVHATYPDAYRAILDGDKILFKGYRGEEVVVVNEVRMSTDINALIQLTGGFAFLAEIRDGMYLRIRPKKVIFVSQHAPHELFGCWSNYPEFARNIERILFLTSRYEDPCRVPPPPLQPPEPSDPPAPARLVIE